MKTYAITYTNNAGIAVTKRLSAPNRFLLTMRIIEDIADMKDDDPDNIIAIEEV